MASLATTTKQDRGSVRTAKDLEQKYNLAALVGASAAKKNDVEAINEIKKQLEEFTAYVVGSLDELQNQIDGNITTHFFNGVPSLDNMPASEWITEEDKANHIGDLYYNRDTGYAYRFCLIGDTYEWTKITDNDVTEALALANAAQDTADNKRRVFTSVPTPPYDSGDLWFDAQEIYICQVSKDKYEVYEEKDFIIATKYTDDTYAKKIGNELTVLSGTVTTIKESFDSFKVDITTTVETLDSELLLAQTSIEANTEQIALKVNRDGIISEINMSNEEILIDAKRVNLVGAVTISALDKNLNTTITNASNNATFALNTVQGLEDRANSGEFKGEDGTGIKSVDVQYYVSSSSTTLTGGSWSSNTPTWVDGGYIWSKTITTYTDNTTTESKAACITGAAGEKGDKGDIGATGKGVSKIQEQYYLSSSSTALSGGSWSVTCPVWSKDKYIWTRSEVTWTDNTTTYTTAILANALNTALSTAKSVDEVIASWCVENNTTLIDGGKIYTKSMHIGKMTIDEDGVLIATFEKDEEIDPTTVDDKYINVSYKYLVDGDSGTNEVDGITSLEFNKISFEKHTVYGSAEYTYNTNEVLEDETRVEYSESGILVNKRYLIDDMFEGEIWQTGSQRSILFREYQMMNSLYSVCDVDFDELWAKIIKADNVETTSGASLNAVSQHTTWNTCTVTAASTYASFSGPYSALYRYDDKVLEIIIRGTIYTKTAVAEGQPLILISGLAISIPKTCDANIWDDTAQIWRRVTLGVDGYIKLASNVSIPAANYWLSGNTLNFKIVRA